MRERLGIEAIRAAIVDLDGTLVDTLGDFDVAIGAMLDELGLPPVGVGFVARMIGKGSDRLVRETLRAAGAPEREAEGLASYRAHYARVNGRYSSVYPGAAEGLAAMRARGWRLACVTNKPLVFAQALLEMKGLAAPFDSVYGGDSFERRKPDPLPFVAACRALASEPAHTLVVGDSSNDAVAARAAGCPVVLATYGYNHGEPIDAAGAHALVDRLDAIVRL